MNWWLLGPEPAHRELCHCCCLVFCLSFFFKKCICFIYLIFGCTLPHVGPYFADQDLNPSLPCWWQSLNRWTARGAPIAWFCVVAFFNFFVFSQSVLNLWSRCQPLKISWFIVLTIQISGFSLNIHRAMLGQIPSHHSWPGAVATPLDKVNCSTVVTHLLDTDALPLSYCPVPEGFGITIPHRIVRRK